MTSPLLRLHLAVSAVCPIDGVSASVIQFKPAATTAERTVGTAVLTSFDFSDAAQVAWQNLQDRSAASTIFMVDTSSSAKVLRATILVLLDEINILRAASVPSLSARTVAQARTAIQAKLDGGTVD